MNEEVDVRDHINKFNKCINLLLSIEVTINEEYQGNRTLIVDEVSTTLLEIKY